MRNKPFAGLAIAMLFALSILLMACGDNTNTPAPAATTAAATTAASATTAAAAATTAAAGATTAAATTAATSATTAAATTAAATTAAAANPSGGTKAKVVVGSKDFTEAKVVGELYAQALEAAGIPVERKIGLGTTDIAQAAITKGEISLYPEYTGTGLQAVLKITNFSNDPKQVYDKVASEYEKQFKLTWLNPSPYNNSNGIAVSKAAADQYKLKTLSDLAPVAKNLRFVSNPEFIGTRSDIDGLKSLQKTYGGFDFKDTKQVDINLRYKSVVDGQADACVAFTTDGELYGYKDKLVLLTDDKQNFPPYNMAPVVRDDVLAAYPNIKDVLNGVSAKLTSENIQLLNWKVAGPDKQEPVDAAKDFLKAQGLIK